MVFSGGGKAIGGPQEHRHFMREKELVASRRFSEMVDLDVPWEA